MTELEKLLKAIRENPIGHDKEWEKLRDRIFDTPLSKGELMELSADIKRFFESDASDEDKMHLWCYTEHLSMKESAVGL